MRRLGVSVQLALLAAAFATPPVAGELASLVADLRTASGPNDSSNPRGFVRLGRRALFQVAQGSSNSGLWATDGTPGRVQRLSPVLPADEVGVLQGAYLWFGPIGSVTGLWRTGGTAASTSPLVPGGVVVPDPDDFRIPWALLGSRLYFFRFAATQELWSSDGTAAGTRRVARLPQLGDRGAPVIAAAARGLLFFFSAARRPGFGNTGYESWTLWRSDGTAAGTRPLADLPHDVLFAHATSNRLVFLVGDQLWASDGSAGGTSALLGPPRDPGLQVAVVIGAAGEKLFFWGRLSSAPGDTKLWVSDGTRRGTRIVRSELSQPPGSATGLILGDRAYFVATDPLHGSELWSSRGTAATTALVADLCPGSCSYFDGASVNLSAAGGHLFLTGTDPARGPVLFASDGTAAGTRRLRELCPAGCAFRDLASAGGEVYFQVRDAARGLELWASDGTAAGTQRLGDFRGAVSGDLAPFGTPTSVAVLGSRVVTAGYDSRTGFEPWVFDRSGGGGQLLADLALGGEPGTDLGEVAVLGDRLIFGEVLGSEYAVWSTRGSAATTDRLVGGGVTVALAPQPKVSRVGERVYAQAGGLWVTDGSPGGTVRLTDLGAAPWGRRIVGSVVDLTGTAVFSVWDGSFDRAELWSSDGTPAGTRPTGLSLPAGISGLTALDEDLFFWGNDSVNGWEVWRAGASLSELHRLTDLDYSPGLAPLNLARSDGYVYFLVPDRSGETALWRSDGTRTGTAQWPNPLVSGKEQWPVAFVLRPGGELLLFTRPRGESRLRFWRSDGTPAGTVLVRDFDTNSSLQQLLPEGTGVVQFVVSSFGDRYEERLYRTDGTPQGTAVLIDFSDLGLEAHSGLLSAGERLYFGAGTSWESQELWSSSGVPAATRRLQEIAPGPAGSAPSPLAVAGSRLYFTADDGLHGRELWSLPLDDLEGPCRPSATALCLGQGRYRAELFLDERNGDRADARAVPWSSRSGAFWHYDYGNPELVVKLVDGTPVNGYAWLFAGSLSDAFFALTVTDLLTGEVWRHPADPGPLSAFADLTAFWSTPPAGPGAQRRVGAGPVPASTDAPRALLPAVVQGPVSGPCLPSPTRLCLDQGRFAIELRYREGVGGAELPARAFAHGAQAGYFAFGAGEDVEFAFKLLDGRSTNGHSWLFATALTDREVTLAITDATDGAVFTYAKPLGMLSSFFDLNTLR